MVAELIDAAPRFYLRDAWLPEDLARRIAVWSPKSDLGRIVRECFAYLPAELAANPDSLSLHTEAPDGTLTTVVLASLTHGGTGAYSYDLLLDQLGTWRYRWIASGTVDGSASRSLTVTAPQTY